MITLEKIINTVTEIVNNDEIYRKGLVLEYTLDEEMHRKLEESVLMKIEGTDVNWDEFEPRDEFEVEIGGMIIKFIKNEN